MYYLNQIYHFKYERYNFIKSKNISFFETFEILFLIQPNNQKTFDFFFSTFFSCFFFSFHHKTFFLFVFYFHICLNFSLFCRQYNLIGNRKKYLPLFFIHKFQSNNIKQTKYPDHQRVSSFTF